MKLRSLQRDVAHICGWTDMVVKPGTRGILYGKHPTIPASNVFGTDGVPVPNFAEDLHYMNIAEGMLKPEEQGRYMAIIAATTAADHADGDPLWQVAHSSAVIRAVSFMQIMRERAKAAESVINANGLINSQTETP